MRHWVSALLFTLAAGWFVAAQQPPADPGRLVIRPGGKGAEPVGPAGKEPDKAGFLVIRPTGKGATTTQVGDPKRDAWRHARITAKGNFHFASARNTRAWLSVAASVPGTLPTQGWGKRPTATFWPRRSA